MNTFITVAVVGLLIMSIAMGNWGMAGCAIGWLGARLQIHGLLRRLS